MIFILFFIFSTNIICGNLDPTHHDKYVTTLLHGEIEGKPPQVETYYVLDSTRQGVIFEPGEDSNMSIYHVDETSDDSYMVFDLGGGLYECMITTVEYEEMDIMDYLLKKIVEYVGVEKCDPDVSEDLECNSWRIKYHENDCLFYETVDSKKPYCVIREKDKKRIYEFQVFKFGTGSFNEKVIFKLPIDPSNCKFFDSPNRNVRRGVKFKGMKMKIT